MEALCVFHSHTVDVVKHLWTWIVAFDRIAVSLNMAATILTWQSINLFSTLGFGTCDHVSLHNNRRVCMHQKQLSPACLFSCVESGRSSKAPLSIGSFDGLLLCVVHVYSFTSQIVISLILKSSGRHDWAFVSDCVHPRTGVSCSEGNIIVCTQLKGGLQMWIELTKAAYCIKCKAVYTDSISKAAPASRYCSHLLHLLLSIWFHCRPTAVRCDQNLMSRYQTSIVR